MKKLDEIFGSKKKDSDITIGTSYDKASGRIHHYGSAHGRAFMHTFKHKTDSDKNSWSDYTGLDKGHLGHHEVHKAIEHSLKNNHGITGHQLKAAHFND